MEMDSIMNGTHPAMIEGLRKPEQVMRGQIQQLDALCAMQIDNINKLFDCEKKQAEDESIAQLDFFRSRLIDQIEEKQKKQSSQLNGGRKSKPADVSSKLPEKRRRFGLTGACFWGSRFCCHVAPACVHVRVYVCACVRVCARVVLGDSVS